jgi:hypothetical protein
VNKRVVFGLPLNPAPLLEQLSGQSFCLSYYHRHRLGKQLDQAIDLVGDDGILLLDNGAFTAWQKGETLAWEHWEKFAEWAAGIMARCPQAVAVTPDVIGGTEQQNAELMIDFMCCGIVETDRCMPVWHMHESLDHLRYLTDYGKYLAIGSSGKYAKVGTPKWHRRIGEALRAINRATIRVGLMRPWLHMMRAQSEMHAYPFDSCDSCNVAVNHGRWRRSHPGDRHVARMAQPILDRVALSCDGVERKPHLSPAGEVRECAVWQGRIAALEERFESLRGRDPQHSMVA